MKPIYVKFYLVPARAKQGKNPIYCRISANRKKSELFTGLYSDPKKWDESKERVKGNPEMNAQLVKINSRIQDYYLEKTYQGISPTAKDLKSMIQGNDRSSSSVLSYFETFISDITKLSDQYTQSTVKKYSTIKKHLSEFLQSIDKKEILISEYSLTLVNEFDFYLRTVAKLNPNTTAKYLKQFKAIFNRAIQFGYINQNPFNGYKFKLQKTNRTFLTKEEIKAIVDLDLPNESLSKVRDCFIFAIYTGLRHSDVCNLTKKQLKTDQNGKHWLEFNIQKTKENSRFPLLDNAYKVVEKYQNIDHPSEKLLPVISHQKINLFLKMVGNLAEIDKTLTFHVARHTFATTVTLSNNVPLEVVQKFLGHSSITSTQIYAKITSEYLLEENEKLNTILSNGK